MVRASKGSSIKRRTPSKDNVHAALDQSGSSNHNVRRGAPAMSSISGNNRKASDIKKGSGAGDVNGTGRRRAGTPQVGGPGTPDPTSPTG